MFEEFQQIDIFRPSIFDFSANLFVALGCGIVIALVYRFTYRGASYSASYVNSLVLLSLITAVVILVIGNNLARAFGLVGAMSIIRFRTAVRDVQDIVFIFFSLSIGMAAGVGLNSVAIIGTLFICLIIILLDSVGFGRPARLKHLLQVTYTGTPDEEATIQSVLKKYCRRIQLMNLRQLAGRDNMEAFYHLSLRNAKKNHEFVQSLRALDFVTQVNLFFEEDENGTPAG
ncbi:MAG: DUF4956 domain-containing protein [Lewinellaceae bacterium]|nr:DUF4956 domain-containing protein [Saprospiraceae bacterium]MCB9340069.1 DUF4956 domain-containing protein [Lewinellaceae bacterium]